MSKSILLSIRPQWIEKILNGEKTIEVRKQFPKDYVGWVYIYCTKGKQELNYHSSTQIILGKTDLTSYGLNGKVVARFWCDKVEEITTEKWSPSKEQDLLKASCLTENQLFDYCNLESGKPFYAIHISKLEIFDRPKELSEFGCYKAVSHYDYNKDCLVEEKSLLPLTKAPQNFCYIEGE